METHNNSTATKPAHSPLPWRTATNPGDPDAQPAFPSIRDASGLPHGEDIVAMPLGDSDTVKANAALITRSVNSHAELITTLEHALEDLQALGRGDAEIQDVCGLIPEIRAAILKATEGGK